ncbi:hypothetical protein ACH9D2_05805 [Kocuria sp. M4R2S49]|uniref:hypothetical protein n=1 Tax=Kocuria rhizosphaericola TaxID=3376284 RepID=UPI0037A13FBC
MSVPDPRPAAAEPEDPFVVNRIPDAELEVTVPFELEASEWEFDGSADEAGGWGSAGDYGLE